MDKPWNDGCGKGNSINHFLMRPFRGSLQVSMTHIDTITLHGISHITFKPELQREYDATRADLLEKNEFQLKEQGASGPYELAMECKENRLYIDVIDIHSKEHHVLQVPMRPFKQTIKDYFYICESYYSTMFSHHPAKVEPIDMARRGLHNEGAEKLMRWLQKSVTLDQDTARRLFTFICILHMR